MRHAARVGITTGSVAVNMQQVRQRKCDMVDGLIATHLARYQASGAVPVEVVPFGWRWQADYLRRLGAHRSYACGLMVGRS